MPLFLSSRTSVISFCVLGCVTTCHTVQLRDVLIALHALLAEGGERAVHVQQGRKHVHQPVVPAAAAPHHHLLSPVEIAVAAKRSPILRRRSHLPHRRADAGKDEKEPDDLIEVLQAQAELFARVPVALDEYRRDVATPHHLIHVAARHLCVVLLNPHRLLAAQGHLARLGLGLALLDAVPDRLAVQLAVYLLLYDGGRSRVVLLVGEALAQRLRGRGRGCW
mmetsp:Transcript_30729/g.98262  ORF Transcript_30729/g.98262 Transcript_30729/m.98262 type:complete len:222 (-) Transcript_30729:1089-1754(-)